MNTHNKKPIIYFIALTIVMSTVSCTGSASMFGNNDLQLTATEAGLKAWGQNMSDLIYTGKSRGRAENERHETYALRENQEETKRAKNHLRFGKWTRGGKKS